MESSQAVLVSVVCNTYNHEKFIRDALEGFVMQKTNFAYEVLIHDDASTDKTADIIREYEAKFPEIIKPIYQTENQYSKGGILQFQEPRIKGKYVALCEGDDYWTDPLKLQKQFDAMEAHPEIDICAHVASSVNAVTGERKNIFHPADEVEILPVESIIMGGGGFVATASLFMRAPFYSTQKEFSRFLRLDYTLQIQGALRGGMLYLPDCMCDYCVMTSGSWTASIAKDKEKQRAHISKVQKMLEILNEETGGKYDTTIRQRILKNEFDLALSMQAYKTLVLKKYKLFYKELPQKTQLKFRLKASFPFLITIKNKLNKKSRRTSNG